jgi:hypothetical protein
MGVYASCAPYFLQSIRYGSSEYSTMGARMCRGEPIARKKSNPCSFFADASGRGSNRGTASSLCSHTSLSPPSILLLLILNQQMSKNVEKKKIGVKGEKETRAIVKISESGINCPSSSTLVGPYPLLLSSALIHP